VAALAQAHVEDHDAVAELPLEDEQCSARQLRIARMRTDGKDGSCRLRLCASAAAGRRHQEPRAEEEEEMSDKESMHWYPF
jgi:hypothetical protein